MERLDFNFQYRLPFGIWVACGYGTERHPSHPARARVLADLAAPFQTIRPCPPARQIRLPTGAARHLDSRCVTE